MAHVTAGRTTAQALQICGSSIVQERTPVDSLLTLWQTERSESPVIRQGRLGMANTATTRQLLISTGLLIGGIALGWGLFSLGHSAQQPHNVVSSETTRIDVDPQTGTIRFIVNGEPVALIDRDGLTIAHNVRYGGLSIDLGEEQARLRLEHPPSSSGPHDE